MNISFLPPTLFSRCTLATSVLLSLSSLSGQANACGGLFCSSSAPVNQAAERILFAQEDGVTTQIVEILYEGPSERFAWVLPVPGSPEVAVSSSQVFDQLQAATNPQYNLQTQPRDCGLVALSGSPEAASGGNSNNGGPRVTVVDAGGVGPFDYETISVDAADEDPADVAIQWLQNNEYDVGALGPDVLRPYLENGLNLIAVRLQKGEATGAIQPLSLTFQGQRPSIPIRPTAVAANDDMGVMVWLLGEARAVPTNYLGLEINEALLDWTNPNGTYNSVISLAADEAGGKGFVTEFAGDAEPFDSTIRTAAPTETDSYLSQETHDALADLALRFGSYDGFSRTLSQHVTFRDQLTADDFIQCSYCYIDPQYSYARGDNAPDYGDSFDVTTDPIMDTDMQALLSDLEEQVFRPIRDAADLFSEHDYVTRLYTTMSAGEMDEDPVFDFNPDLEDVSNIHTATREFLGCETPEWVVTLEDGRQIYSDKDGNWPFSIDDDDEDRLPANARILSFSTSGPGEVQEDNMATIDRRLDETSRALCSFSPARNMGATHLLLAWFGVLGGAYVLRRRRRPTHPR